MKKRKILLRFDDICPTMNWEQWNKAKSLLDSINATALLGVIPDCKDPDLQIDEPQKDFWDYIKRLQTEGYAIAMHGYQHVFDIKASGICTPVKHSEFAGHSYEEQYRRIKEGKRILNDHGIETDIFFAPAHSYDNNTLKALSANGFKYVSDGRSLKPYMRHGIICYPERSGGIPKMKDDGYYTVVIHAHEWVREDRKYVYERFMQLFKDRKNVFVNFEDYMVQQTIGNSMFQGSCESVYRVLREVKKLIR